MSRTSAKAHKTPARPSPHGETRPGDLDRHARKCSVCRHPKRGAIERAFLHRCSPDMITDQYDFSDRKSVYRHARATGLWARRKRKACSALENLLERAGEATVTASAVISTVQADTHINDAGEWVKPPAPSRSPLVTHHSSPPSSNRNTQELENEPTR